MSRDLKINLEFDLVDEYMNIWEKLTNEKQKELKKETIQHFITQIHRTQCGKCVNCTKIL